MELKVWKYALDTLLCSKKTLTLPVGSKILSFQYQDAVDDFCIWVLVDARKDIRTEQRTILVVGTGHVISTEDINDIAFIGTTQVGNCVFHAFEIIKGE